MSAPDADDPMWASLFEQGDRWAEYEAAGNVVQLNGHRPSRPDELRAALLDVAGLRAIPDPDPLISGWLHRDSLAWLGGKPGNGKTFVAIDMACSIATGTPWQGCDVVQGDVLYLIAEGAAGLSRRVDAWQLGQGISHIPGIRFLPVPVQMLNLADAAALSTVAAELAVAMIVLDTQARVTLGADENSSKDMGMFVAALDQLRCATRACVLSVHHEPRSAENLRGSTALEGAADTIIRVSKDGDLLEVTNPKQKDAPESDPKSLQLVSLGEGAKIIPATGATTTESERVLLALIRGFGTSGASTTALIDASDVSRRSALRAISALHNKGLIHNTANRPRTCWIVASLDAQMVTDE